MNIPSYEEQIEAGQRARMLLLKHLNESQRATYNQYGWFIVTGSDRRRYVVFNKHTILGFNRRGKLNRAYGFHPRVTYRYDHPEHPWMPPRMPWAEEIPLADTLLGQKLCLETNARRVRKVSCKTSKSVALSYYYRLSGLPGYLRDGLTPLG